MAQRKKFRERSELTQRVVSALVLVAIALPLILIGGKAVWLMSAVLAGLCFYEWRLITRGSGGKFLAIGLVYCALPLLLPIIRENDNPPGLALLILLFLAVIASDVFAYFSGRTFGGPKLLPAVSPKKTWSGALGGLFGAMVIGGLFAAYVSPLAVGASIFGAAILSVFSQAGDLLESWVKRRFGVKDSSQLIPGHGGFLDRVDGLLGALVPMTVYALFTT